jgi:hypothetical protein
MYVLFICVYVCMYCLYVYMCEWFCMYMYMYMYIWVCTCMYINIYIYPKNIYGIVNDADNYVDGSNNLSTILKLIQP